MDPKASFGQAVRGRRLRLGLSQEDLADRAALDRTYVSGVERGRRNPTLMVMQRLAAALEIDLAKLVAQRDRVKAGARQSRVKSDGRARAYGGVRGNRRPAG